MAAMRRHHFPNHHQFNIPFYRSIEIDGLHHYFVAVKTNVLHSIVPLLIFGKFNFGFCLMASLYLHLSNEINELALNHTEREREKTRKKKIENIYVSATSGLNPHLSASRFAVSDEKTLCVTEMSMDLQNSCLYFNR